jgi:hypothetical protein
MSVLASKTQIASPLQKSMVFMEKMVTYYENVTKQMFMSNDALFNIIASGTYSYHYHTELSRPVT